MKKLHYVFISTSYESKCQNHIIKIVVFQDSNYSFYFIISSDNFIYDTKNYSRSFEMIHFKYFGKLKISLKIFIKILIYICNIDYINKLLSLILFLDKNIADKLNKLISYKHNKI